MSQHWSESHSWIVKHFKQFSFSNSTVELVLAIQAMELHSGSLYSFYVMLKFMKSSKKNVQHLAAEIKQKTEAFDLNKSSGM